MTITPAADPVPAPVEAAAEPAPAPAPEPMAAPEPAPIQPTAATMAPTQPAYDPSAEPEEDGKVECALGELCMGPVFTLGAINPIGLGLHARYGDNWGFGFDYQFIPSLNFGSASAGWGMIDVEARWYPFGGAFFLGGGFAYQYFNATASAGAAGTRIDVEGSVGIPGMKLGLGFMGRSGFVMGIDLGLNIPLGGTSVDFDAAMGGGAANLEMVESLKSDIRDAAKQGVGLIPVIPQLNLLRIGYLF